MAKDRKSVAARPSPSPVDSNTAPGAASPELSSLLKTAEVFLQEGETSKALDVLGRAKVSSPWVTNALGVCQLRLGNTKLAVEVFRGLVLATGGLILRRDVPVVFLTNYATALLASGNLEGCQTVLAEIRDEANQAVRRLREAILRWQQLLTFLEKLNWWLGSQPNHSPALNFPLGDIA